MRSVYFHPRNGRHCLWLHGPALLELRQKAAPKTCEPWWILMDQISAAAAWGVLVPNPPISFRNKNSPTAWDPHVPVDLNHLMQSMHSQRHRARILHKRLRRLNGTTCFIRTISSTICHQPIIAWMISITINHFASSDIGDIGIHYVFLSSAMVDAGW